jgi:hypothetical protein
MHAIPIDHERQKRRQTERLCTIETYFHLLNHSDGLIIGKPKPSVLPRSPERASMTPFDGKNNLFRHRRHNGGVQSEFVTVLMRRHPGNLDRT